MSAERMARSDVFSGDYVMTFEISTTPLAKSLTADVVWTSKGYEAYMEL